MKKRDFIQASAAHFMVAVNWDVNKAIDYAERLWQRLGERGYGESKPHEPKAVGEDYYSKLSPDMQAAFDKFWLAFGYKSGKQGAAMRWYQFGEMPPDKCQKIIKAAAATAVERKKLPPEQVPIMAQGWLNALRFDDFDETALEKGRKAADAMAAKFSKINGDLNHAKQMAQMGDGGSREYWRTQVDKLTEELRKLREDNAIANAKP